MLKTFLFLSVGFLFFGTNAQQLPFFRTEIYSPQWHNAASYATWNKLGIHALTQLSSISNDYFGSGQLSGEGFIGTGAKESGIGLGGNFQFEKIGFYTNQRVTTNVNYQIAFSKWSLSVGAAPGLTLISSDPEWIPPTSDPDPNLPLEGTQTKFTMGAGIFAFSDKFYVGISGSQLNSPLFDELNYQSASHFFVNAGYRFKAPRNIQIFPSVNAGFVDSFTLLSATCLVQFMKPAITIGSTYSKQFIQGLIGYEFRGMSFLYGLGTSFSQLTNAVNLSHELRLSYRIKKEQKCSTCEYF